MIYQNIQMNIHDLLQSLELTVHKMDKEMCGLEFVSNDGTEWKELYKSEPITSNQSAYAVDIDISNYKYLRL